MPQPWCCRRFCRPFALAVVMVLMAGAALAEEHVCKHSLNLIGACRRVHGGVFLSPDALLIMTFANDRTRVSISAPPDSDWDMPDAMYDIFNDDLHADVEGEFEICPVPLQIGFVDSAACIESAANLVIRYGDGRIERRP